MKAIMMFKSLVRKIIIFIFGANKNSSKPIEVDESIREIENAKLDKMSYAELVNWLRYSAGTSNSLYFNANLDGKLKLQQIPEEYACLLLFLSTIKPDSYLEIGIGNGGSWLLMSYFLKGSLKMSHSVDNLSYSEQIKQSRLDIEKIEEYLSNLIDEVKFYQSESTDFLNMCKNHYKIIFIDGDHSYEGVKKDYENSRKLVKNDGVIIFHDINSNNSPGVKKFWSELKESQPFFKEFISGETCGIGVIFNLKSI